VTLLARDNPFRTARIGSLAFRHPRLSFDAVAGDLESLELRAEIVGPHGSGKTTLLGQLGGHLEREGFAVHRWRLFADRRPPPSRTLVREASGFGPRDVLLVDGAGHLSRPTWWRVARAARGAGGLVITAHESGRLPTLLETRTDLALLASLTRELVGTRASALEATLSELFDAHGGNLRDVFLALYDLAAAGDPRLGPHFGASAQEFSSSTSGPPSPVSPISSSSAGTMGSVSDSGFASSASVVGIPMRKAAKPGITT
jgi:hypothetical protein